MTVAVFDDSTEEDGLDATAHLLSSEVNARRLREAIRELEAGGGQVHELIEPTPETTTKSAT